MEPTRRQALLGALFGSGWLGLRSLATGLPLGFLARPSRALADGACELDPGKAQYLVLATSSFGDPVNANVPGTYLDPRIAHPADPTMAKASMELGGKTWDAAAPWAQLPAATLARTCFFHHTTLTNSHANQGKVMALMGASKRQEMMVSAFAAKLAPCLGTVQSEPVVVGAASSGELLTFRGRVLPKLSPSGLRDTLTTPTGPLAQLQKLRDRDLDALHQLFKQSGNNVQRAFLDRMAISQSQVRNIAQDLLEGLSSIKGDDANNQIIAAATLIKMKVAPVVSIHIPFGGDNHTDADLAREAAQTVSGVATLQALIDRLAAQGLGDQVTFAQMNVFGRTLSTKGTTGRDHLANHHCSVLIGKNVRSSVVGGVVAKGNDFAAQAIDSKSGAGVDGGDIPFADTLGALGKTLGTALGLSQASLDEAITVGKPVLAALAP